MSRFWEGMVSGRSEQGRGKYQFLETARGSSVAEGIEEPCKRRFWNPGGLGSNVGSTVSLWANYLNFISLRFYHL